jgi:RNA polymerase sigma factor (sigma-70 family)
LSGWDEAMRAIREGSEDGLRSLMSSLRYPLESLARRLLGDRGAAQDAVQEALLRIWRNREQYDPERPAWPWIAGIVRNACHERWRRSGGRQRAGPVDELPLEYAAYVHCPRPAPDAAVHQADLARRVRTHVADLPPTLREVVQLAFFDDMTNPEIAALLGIPVGTVKSRKHRALQSIRARIDGA